VSSFMVEIAAARPALSSMDCTEPNAFAATSNSAWAKPIGWVHCFWVAWV
jgi:hypothetical protein